MKSLWLPFTTLALLAGCAGGLPDLGFGRDRGLVPPEVSVNEAPDDDVTRPRARSADAREAAEAPPQPGAGGYLGETLAGLGSPAEQGLWLRTGLVSETRQGRVESAEGDAVSLELRPSGTDPGAGSQLSLAAMQALGLPLSTLATIRVFVD
jgi:hypothetical protein